MKRFSLVLVGLILLIFTFPVHAASPFIYGIHDHDTNPQEYLDHIRNGGASGIPRPTVVITEFGWVYNDIAKSVGQAMEVGLPWAAELYAPYPQVLGASIWYLGPGFGDVDDKTQQLIAPMTEYSLLNYFVIPAR